VIFVQQGGGTSNVKRGEEISKYLGGVKYLGEDAEKGGRGKKGVKFMNRFQSTGGRGRKPIIRLREEEYHNGG